MISGSDGPPASKNSELLIGSRLRWIRKNAGLSQRALAELAGVSSVTVSLIEQDKHAPSVVTLHRLLSAISVPLSEFFDLPDTTSDVVFDAPGQLTQLIRGTASIKILAGQRRDKKLQMFHETYDKGASTGDEFIVHEGDTAVLVISGKIRVEAGTVERVLEAGGGFQTFNGTPYRLSNVFDGQSVIVCAVTPVMF